MADAHNLGDPGHGHSTAAWTGTTVILVATLFVCLGMILSQAWLWILGVVGLAGGTLAWSMMNKAGFGEHGSRSRRRRR